LVLDPGYSSTRAGFAGEDVPKSVVPSYYGYQENAGSDPRYLFGDNSIHTPLPNVSVRNPMADDGTVDDWETATKLWEYAITSRLTNMKPTAAATKGLNDPAEGQNGTTEADIEVANEGEKPLEENPLLMTETGWNSAKNREKSIQIAMEDWGAPAFWLGRNGVCAA
jgi:actin-related protein 4